MKQFTRRTERFFENAGYLLMGGAVGVASGTFVTSAFCIVLFAAGAVLVAFCMVDLWLDI